LAALLAFSASLGGATGRAATAPAPAFRIAWGTALQTSRMYTGANFSCRYNARSALTGDAVEVRFSNAFGGSQLVLGAATAGIRAAGATLASSPVRLTFGGRPSVVLQAGQVVTSDPAPLAVRAGQDVAVSVWYPGRNPQLSLHMHWADWVTNACTDAGGAAGDHTADLSGGAYTVSGRLAHTVDALAVHATGTVGAVAIVGDSVSDGYCPPPPNQGCLVQDGYQRWPDLLARRLEALPAGRRLGLANEAIGGNAVSMDVIGPSAYNRLSRDALSQAGVTTVLLYEGVNDIIHGASSAQVIGYMQGIITRAHAAGVRVVGATITPVWGAPLWTTQEESTRRAVNAFILGDVVNPGGSSMTAVAYPRVASQFDAVLDFNRVLSDPTHTMLQPQYDSGDHLHPDVRGLQALADSIYLSLLS
jgi:lysophospholipase L1-like esterase